MLNSYVRRFRISVDSRIECPMYNMIIVEKSEEK